ncbi:DNA mismatch endonuclease Vsr [Idiomarina loihiensis]|uniref:very short patch repair endonuclease n=1 Tax=Idiomarina loihiensis TaxID=135577 RepID=UPI00129CB1C2|nr:very short patch repair endonuclease [Idiomarina loihiensis]MRJ45808.1 DNA mismatch endonuclease Vsr [Idiomarina loihiensis]UTW32752.1 DNA mismatch endonuclease Vsr [Idiomarina loihiensis]
MADVHNKDQRRKNMRAIKSADTSIEVRVRKMLWHAGYRYRLNVKSLPGTPDIYLPKYRAAIQINGCLWHGHNCPQFVLPKTKTEFWKNKISSNVQRDLRNIRESRQQNVRVLLIWECAIRGNGRLEPDYLLKLMSRWLPTDDSLSVIDKQGIRSLSQDDLKAQFNKVLN